MKADTDDGWNEVMEWAEQADTIEIQLTEEQERAAVKLANNKEKRGIVFHKIGEGKTRVAIAWSFLVCENPKPIIICSPGAFRQWTDEIELLGLSNVLKPKFISVGKLAKHSYAIDFKEYNCVIVDELWMFKNPFSQRSKAITWFTNRVPCIGLSGVLMTAGNVEDIYGQSLAMNLGHKLATSLTSFRTQFMIKITNYAGFIERYPRRGAFEKIQRRLVSNIDLYFPKERREIRSIAVKVEPTKEQLELKKRLAKEYYVKKDDFELEITQATTLLVKCQQISDGFIRNEEGNYLHIKSNKASRLKELCKELLDSGERVLVWCGFRKTTEMLSELFTEETTILSGDGKFDVTGWKSGKVRICFATVGSGASLNDFSNIRYAIFYSTTFSTLAVQQAKGRTNRKSSLANCVYYYMLQTEKFPDARIYEKIDQNKSVEEDARKIVEEMFRE